MNEDADPSSADEAAEAGLPAQPGTAGGGGDRAVKEEAAVRQVSDTLAARYSDALPADQIAEAVGEARDDFAAAPIRDFVPVLVERRARELLDARAVDTEAPDAESSPDASEADDATPGQSA